MRFLFTAVLVLAVPALAGSQSIRIVDKDRHDFGVEASITDRVSKAVITNTDQNGVVVDASVFRSKRLVQISAIQPSSYFVLKLDCPFNGTLIEMQSVDRIKILAWNSFALAAKEDPAAALAFSELAARTESIDFDYSQMMRKRSIEVAILPILDAVTLNELNKALLDNKIVDKPLTSKSQVTSTWFLTDDKLQGKFVINQAYSQLITQYQDKQAWSFDYRKGQLDYLTLKSFSAFRTNELLFKKLVAAGVPEVPLPKGLTQ